MNTGKLIPLHGFWYTVKEVTENGARVVLERREATSKAVKRATKNLTRLGIRAKI